MTGSTGLAQSRSYTYDRDGNRRTKTVGADTWTYVHDRTDQLVSVTKNVLASQSFGYDAYGNLTSDAETGTAVTAMTYDLADRLTTIDASGTTNDTTFTLDALGRFRTRAVAGVSDTYSYVGASETVARIATAGGSTLDSIVSPAGDRLGVKDATTLNYLVPDLHGNVAGSLDASEATLVNAIRYDAWGETIGTGSAGGTAVGAGAWTYQGRLEVSPAGLSTPLYDMSARFYAPGIAAFTSLDSVMGATQDPLSMNRFLYAEANPATLIDPTGHYAVWGDGTSSTDRTGPRRSTAHTLARLDPKKKITTTPRGRHTYRKRTARAPGFSIRLAKERRFGTGFIHVTPERWASFDEFSSGGQTGYALQYGPAALRALASGAYSDADAPVVFETADLFDQLLRPSRSSGLSREDVFGERADAINEQMLQSGDGWKMWWGLDSVKAANAGLGIAGLHYAGGGKASVSAARSSGLGPSYFTGASGGGGGTVRVSRVTRQVEGGSATVNQALTGADRWLGRGYTEIAPGVFRSADGTRQFRMRTSDITGAHGNAGPHVHFESIGPDGRWRMENSHVMLTDR